ncbi:Protein FAM92A1 [Heterocephalus glaber]|uniref:Protein FAM92A1 n=1 Tax=Heterocephalus glaber TaxID=10181 RepID=G5BCD0_HETGA|nr:Protein FAM92A1 [Heterocephalus glaber]
MFGSPAERDESAHTLAAIHWKDPRCAPLYSDLVPHYKDLEDTGPPDHCTGLSTEVERLEAKVVEPLKAYGAIVKLKRDDLKAALTARNREAKQLTQLERTRQQNPSDRHAISQAGAELHIASTDVTRTTRHLEKTIDDFEKQKIKDIKNIFSEFITIEMLFHGKALEVYTAAYQNIQKIDEDEDLEVFLNSLYPLDYPSRLDIVKASSKSPLQRSLSAKGVSGTVQVYACRLRKDQHAEDDEDEEVDFTEEEN